MPTMKTLPARAAPADGGGLPALVRGRQALSEARTADDAQRVEAAARAMRELCATQDADEAQFLAVEASVLAMEAARRVGELLPPPASGGRGKTVSSSKQFLGKVAASRYRAIAAIPADVFCREIDACRKQRAQASQNKFLKLAPKKPAKPRKDVAHIVWAEKHLERMAQALRDRAKAEADASARSDLAAIGNDLEEIASRLAAKRAGLTGGPVPWGEQGGTKFFSEDD